MKQKFKPGDTITWEVKTEIKVTTKEIKENGKCNSPQRRLG